MQSLLRTLCVIVHASCTGSSHQKQAFAPLNSSNPQTTGQKGKSARKACCSLTALCTWLHMLPVQDPKTKSKQLALPVFKLQKQLFHPGKIFTVLAKLSATSNFQQFSQLYKTGNTVTVLPKHAAHALRAIATCTRSRKQNPLAFGHVQLNVHANFNSCIKQEKL